MRESPAYDGFTVVSELYFIYLKKSASVCFWFVCFLKSLYNSSHLKGCNSNFAVAWASGFAVCWWKPCSICVHAWVLSVTLKVHSSQKDWKMLGLLELAKKDISLFLYQNPLRFKPLLHIRRICSMSASRHTTTMRHHVLHSYFI